MKRLLEGLEKAGHIRNLTVPRTNNYSFLLTRPLIELQVRRRVSDLGFGIKPGANEGGITQRGFGIYPAGEVGSSPVITLHPNKNTLGWQRPEFGILEGEKPLPPDVKRKIARFFESVGR